MTQEKLVILNHSLHVFCAEIEQAILSGYSIDWEAMPPTYWGVMHEVGMVKNVGEGKHDAVFDMDATVGTNTLASEQPLKRGPGRPKVK